MFFERFTIKQNTNRKAFIRGNNNKVVINGVVITDESNVATANFENFTFEFPGDDVDGIKVSLPSVCEIEVIGWNEQNVKMNIKAAQKENIEVICHDGILSVKETKGSGFVSSCELFLPQKIYDSLFISTTSGDIKIANTAVIQYDCETKSGDIEAQNVDFTRFNANVASGDVTVSGSLLEDGNVDITTKSGDIEIDLDNLKATDVNACTKSGDIDIDVSPMKGQYTLHGNVATASGDVEIG